MLRSVARQLGTHAGAALGLGPAAGWAALHARAPLLASLQVKIPALGESISDGTVSAVLKQAGDRVEEDEPILQIETDKVTVDVRAPRAGVIEAILVKEDENVEVGHVVASLGDGAEAAAAAPQPAEAAPAPQPTAQPPKQKQKKAAAAKPAAEPAAAAPAARPEARRTPAITFPPRRTPDGQLISALPKASAEQLLASLLGGGVAEPPAADGSAPEPAPPAPQDFRNMIAVPIVGGGMPILRGPPVPAGAPGPARRTMSDREMEAIMLGGADP